MLVKYEKPERRVNRWQHPGSYSFTTLGSGSSVYFKWPSNSYPDWTDSYTAFGDYYEATILGSGGHDAFPHHAIDPVYITAQIVNAIHGIPGRPPGCS